MQREEKEHGHGVAPLCTCGTPSTDAPPSRPPPLASCPSCGRSSGATERPGLGTACTLLFSGPQGCAVTAWTATPFIHGFQGRCVARPHVPHGRESGTLQSRVPPSRSRAPARVLQANPCRARGEDRAAGSCRWVAMSHPQVPGDVQGPPWSLIRGTEHSWEAVTLTGKLAEKAEAADRAPAPGLTPAFLCLPAGLPWSQLFGVSDSPSTARQSTARAQTHPPGWATRVAGGRSCVVPAQTQVLSRVETHRHSRTECLSSV